MEVRHPCHIKEVIGGFRNIFRLQSWDGCQGIRIYRHQGTVLTSRQTAFGVSEKNVHYVVSRLFCSGDRQYFSSHPSRCFFNFIKWMYPCVLLHLVVLWTEFFLNRIKYYHVDNLNLWRFPFRKFLSIYYYFINLFIEDVSNCAVFS